MGEINEAYSLLSKPEIREKYDREGDNFFTANTNFNPESDPEYARWKEEYELNKEQAEILREILEINKNQRTLLVRMWAINKISIASSWVNNEGANFSDLDSNLWAPFTSWGEKLEMEEDEKLFVFEENGIIDKENSPIYKFVNEMIKGLEESSRKWKAEKKEF